MIFSQKGTSLKGHGVSVFPLDVFEGGTHVLRIELSPFAFRSVVCRATRVPAPRRIGLPPFRRLERQLGTGNERTMSGQAQDPPLWSSPFPLSQTGGIYSRRGGEMAAIEIE